MTQASAGRLALLRRMVEHGDWLAMDYTTVPDDRFVHDALDCERLGLVERRKRGQSRWLHIRITDAGRAAIKAASQGEG